MSGGAAWTAAVLLALAECTHAGAPAAGLDPCAGPGAETAGWATPALVRMVRSIGFEES